MKIVLISEHEDSQSRLKLAKELGYLTFVLDKVDPERKLMLDPFFYIYDDSELLEKIKFLKRFPASFDSVSRL